jgi:uncharacterized protein
MRHLLITILLILSSSLLKAQNGNKIVMGTIDTVHSKILGEDRPIWVYVPNSGRADIYLQKKYPVLYLLDGDAHFYSVVGMIEQFSTVNGNTVCPEMIVVGIPNTDRTRDLTPTHYIDDMGFGSDTTSGGGENFIAFIEKELMPYIESNYPTEPYRMLIGHSLGGLTVMNTIVKHKNLFNAYVAIDPSMWWDNKKLLNESREVFAKDSFKGKSLYLAIANTMDEGMDTTRVKSDTAKSTAHIRSILELNTLLTGSANNGLKYKGKYYADDDHGSVPMISEIDALHFIFDFLPLKLSFDEQVKFDSTVIAKHEKHYAEISQKMGYPIQIPENFINGIGYQKLMSKDYANAEYLFKLNIKNYPSSFNVYDSMGDYFVEKNDKKNAIINFKKALSLKEFPETRAKLEKLQKQ